MKKQRNLAAKIILLASLISNPFITSTSYASAGIPVADALNLQQNITSAMEAVAQTLQQIDQYKAQLLQYENQLQNTLAPAAYIWDQAQSTINSLMDATNTLSYYQNQLGSVDNYLNKFQDVAYYRGSPCFSKTGCSEFEWAAMEENKRLASESQKKANDALFKGLEKQQASIQADAKQLQLLQTKAQSAKGQMEAIGYANQLASNQSNQLLQIRGLLMSQFNAVTTQMQSNADKEAQQQAASEQLRKGTFVASPKKEW